ncbi:MAG: MFS transporter [Candidatus Paceibacterota bacterium]
MRNKNPLPILFITLLIDMIGIGMVIPIIPIIFTDPTSSSFLLGNYPESYWFIIAGLATGLYGLMQFIAAPILGELSDIYGRKKLLTVGVGVLALSQLVFGFGILAHSLFLLLASRLIGGLAGANFSIAQASIADVSKPEDKAKNFGLIGAAFGIGFIAGPALGGFLASTFHSASAPFWVAGMLGILNLIWISVMLPETHLVREAVRKKITIWRALHNIRDAFTDKDASPLYRATFFYYMGFSFFTSFSGIYLVHKYSLSEGGLGTYFAAVGIWVVITQVFILRIVTKHYKEKQILRFSIISVATAILVLPFMPNLAFQYFLLPLISIPQGLSMANMSALISKSVSPSKQGAALGISGSLSAMSQGLVPTLAGLISSFAGVKVPFIIGGLCMYFSWYTLFRKVK